MSKKRSALRGHLSVVSIGRLHREEHEGREDAGASVSLLASYTELVSHRIYAFQELAITLDDKESARLMVSGNSTLQPSGSITTC